MVDKQFPQRVQSSLGDTRILTHHIQSTEQISLVEHCSRGGAENKWGANFILLAVRQLVLNGILSKYIQRDFAKVVSE